MALHIPQWVNYVIVGWPIVSLILAPFIGRFLAISSDRTGRREFRRDELNVLMLDVARRNSVRG